MEIEQNNDVMEMVQDEAFSGESVAEVEVNYEEVLANMYEELQAQTELLVETREKQVEINQALVALESVLVVLVVMGILEFCWSCMRQWRKNILKIGD